MSTNKPSNNNFTIKIANVNGTGSASANGLLMKSLFRLGIPVVGKNYFPSNIQGLPTWYEIRASEKGYLARSGRVDVMIAMNAETYQKDLHSVTPGGILIYDSTWPRNKQLQRDDITVIGVPLSKMCNENFPSARARILMKNVVYVGVVAALLDIDLDVIRSLLNETFAKKVSLLDGNQLAIDLGYNYAKEHFSCPLPYTAKVIDRPGKGTDIMIDGNTAAGLGAVYAGATVCAWYPITPSTSLIEGYKKYCEVTRKDPDTGKNNYCIVQAEDELAAMGMVLGAGWNGARAFTSTSGPGVSLMSEFLGYGYFAEIPAVLFNVQRCGPSTGMPTRTQQSDILSSAYASHGDTRHVCLFPADPEESFYMSANAFDLAEHLQTPILVLSDLDIGMNDWLSPELTWDENYQPDRGQVLTKEQLEEMTVFHRYVDSSGDGVAPRTLPGTHARGAYFTRGSGHNMYGAYTEDANEYQEVVDRLMVKWNTAKGLVPQPITIGGGNAIGFVSIGSCDHAVREARDELAEAGISSDYMRVRAFPFSQDVQDFLDAHDKIYVVEQNRDSQLKSLMRLELRLDDSKTQSILHYNGLPMTPGFVIDAVNADLSRGEAA